MNTSLEKKFLTSLQIQQICFVHTFHIEMELFYME